jgi:hypothetical protein
MYHGLAIGAAQPGYGFFVEVLSGQIGQDVVPAGAGGLRESGEIA